MRRLASEGKACQGNLDWRSAHSGGRSELRFRIQRTRAGGFARMTGGRRGLPWLVGAVLACAVAVPDVAGATPTFLSAINLSAGGQDAFEPQIAVDSSGNYLAVWTRYDGTNTRIQAQM